MFEMTKVQKIFPEVSNYKGRKNGYFLLGLMQIELIKKDTMEKILIWILNQKI